MSHSSPPRYSVVVTVYNGAATVAELMARIEKVMQPYIPYELLMIDDLSSDDSWEVMKTCKGGKEYIRLLRLTRNFGQAAAMICGLQEAKADTIITIDDDLQYQPEDIPRLIEHFDPERHYTVFGVPRKETQGFRGRISLAVDRLIQGLAFPGYRHKLRFSSFRISTRKKLDRDKYNERAMRGVHIFFTMVSPQLMDYIEVDYKQRKKGRSGYSVVKRVQLLLEIMITLTELPVRLFLYLTFLFVLAGILLTGIAVFQPDWWPPVLNTALLAFAGACVFIGFAFLFIYVRKVYLGYLGAEVYAIWQEG